MRSATYIRALGRHSIETSQPPAENQAAAEESVARAAELVKAQNDVLATIGVCMREREQSQEKDEQVVAENEAGFVLGAVDLTVHYLASWPLVGLRNRLQTYRGYAGLRYRDVLRLVWAKQRLSQYLAGMPAHLCFETVSLTRDYVQARFLVWLSHQSFFNKAGTKKPKRRRWLGVLQKALSFAEWFFIYPLYYHSNLQTLHLIPPRPFFPSWKSLIPFSAASPLCLPHLAGPLLSWDSATTILAHVSTSYFLWAYIHNSVWARVQLLAIRRLMRVLPKPEARGRMPYVDDEESVFDRYDAALRPPRDAASADGDDDEADADALPAGRTAIVIEELSGVDGAAPTLSASVRIDADSRGAAAAEGAQPALAAASAATAATAASASVRDRQAEEARAAAADERLARRTTYRNTTLSNHPVDVLASHLADGLATLALLWLESAVQRLLACSFLRGARLPAPDVAARVYAPLASPANWALVVKNIVVGEMGLMWVLFEVSYGVCSFIGLRRFGYMRKI